MFSESLRILALIFACVSVVRRYERSAAYDALPLALASEGNSSQPAVSSSPNSSVAPAASLESLPLFSPTSPSLLAAVANAV